MAEDRCKHCNSKLRSDNKTGVCSPCFAGFSDKEREEYFKKGGRRACASKGRKRGPYNKGEKDDAGGEAGKGTEG